MGHATTFRKPTCGRGSGKGTAQLANILFAAGQGRSGAAGLLLPPPTEAVAPRRLPSMVTQLYRHAARF
jgi:hypothetical protein